MAIGEEPKKCLGEPFLFIEACCGSALLSSCASKAGFDVLAIDFHGNKHRPFVHVVELDMRKRSTWSFLEHLARSRRPFHFHAAPPCGTASRARDVPLSDDQYGPPPLRSEEYPLGFPWLTGFWKDKVESANSIYLHLVAFCFFLNLMGVGWSVENPGRSYLWSIEDYKILIAAAYFVLFHACVHGSQRKKLTALLTNRQQFTVLAGYCQGDHEHLPWSHKSEDGQVIFDTSKEAAYPKMFCERFANVLAEMAGIADLRVTESMHDKSSLHDARVATHKQPRGRQIASLVSEYACVKTVRTAVQEEPLLTEKQTLLEVFHNIPAGSKLLRTAKAKRGSSEDDHHFVIRVFGIYRTMQEFFSLATKVIHPFDSFRAVPDALLQVVCRILSRAPLETMKMRLEKLKHWRCLADSLAGSNNKIFSNMDAGCALVLRGKHLALLEKLAGDIDWPDKNIHEEIRHGFKLIGMQEPSGVFAADIKPRSLTEEELIKQLKFLKPALWGKVESGSSADYDEELWESTMQEMKEKHWLEGPYSRAELDVLFDEAWLPVRRFAVWQRSKWRAIDDFSECGVNSTFSYLEKVDLKALDEIVWMACCFVKHCIYQNYFDFNLASGERLCGSVDPAWTQLPKESLQLVAKTVDLKSAYKQFPICPEHRKYSVLVLKRPDNGTVAGFISKTLPFGSVASVLHFNRISRLLHALGLQLDVAWSNYYDDFPVVDFKVLADHTAAAIRALTSMLGFECSLDKEAPFANTAEMLGVVLDLQHATAGTICVANKPSRLEELQSAVKDIIAAKTVVVRDLPSLFGRALFVESQFMGREGRLALADLRIMERSKSQTVKLSCAQLEALRNLLLRYQKAAPRSLKVESTSLPLVVFTDGACEPDGEGIACMVGGVLFDPSGGGHVEAFGAHVNPLVVKTWMEAGKKHPVALTELYAVCVARSIWKGSLDDRKCVFFIDNQGDVDALIKGYSSEDTMKSLLTLLEKLDCDRPFLPWFCRVPSQSNISDLPSRGRWKELRELLPSYQFVEAVCPFDSTKLRTILQTD